MLFALSGVAQSESPITLDDAVRRALAYAPSNQGAIAQSDLTAAQVREARAPLFPSIAANGEYNQAPGYDQTITNGGLTLAQLALGYTAFDGGRRAARVRAADYVAQAARLGVNAARAQIVFDTTVAYGDLLRTHYSVAELQRSAQRLAQYVTIISNLQHSGRAIANDTLKIRTTRDANELALASARQAASHAAIILAALIGEPNPAALTIAGDAPSPAIAGEDLSHSPTVAAAERQLQAARFNVTAAQAEHSPTVTIALTTGWEGINPPKTFGHHLGASYDGAISVPLFEGGLVRAHIDEARAGQEAALAQVRQVELNLKRDFADARSRYQAALDKRQLLAAAQTTASDAFALDWTRFLGGGNVTLLEVTDAYQTAENLHIASFDNEFELRQAVAEANLLLGVDR